MRERQPKRERERETTKEREINTKERRQQQPKREKPPKRGRERQPNHRDRTRERQPKRETEPKGDNQRETRERQSKRKRDNQREGEIQPKRGTATVQLPVDQTLSIKLSGWVGSRGLSCLHQQGNGQHTHTNCEPHNSIVAEVSPFSNSHHSRRRGKLPLSFNYNHFTVLTGGMAHGMSTLKQPLPFFDHDCGLTQVLCFVAFSVRDATRKRVNGPRSVFDESAWTPHAVVAAFTWLCVARRMLSRVCLFRFPLQFGVPSTRFTSHRTTLPHEERGSC